MNFPSICVDNFYDNPDEIREFALSLDYSETENGKYPGKRTEPLNKISNEFFHSFCQRLFSVYYDFQIPVSWKVSTQFQLIEPFDLDPNSPKNKGWIHQDQSAVFAGIIYLNKNPLPETGTSIFDVKDINKYDIDQHKRRELYNDGVDNDYDSDMIEHLSNFNETIRYDNKYNRLVSFDSQSYHGVNSFYTKNEPRLTQAFFILEMETESLTPLDRMRRNEIRI